jgi:hypothetical protein
MARALTLEDKAAKALLSAFDNRTFNRYNLAAVLMSSETRFYRNMAIATACAILEIAAVAYDYGDFDSDGYKWYKVAHACRETITEHALMHATV